MLVLLLAELAIFHFLAPSFLTGKNAAEIARLSVETGLLVLAQTCVIVTGGIDLSVGSMMGLSAVVLGWLWLRRACSACIGRIPDALPRRAGRASKRRAHHSAASAAVDRDTGNLQPVSWSGRRTHRRRSELHGLPRLFSVCRPRLLDGPDSTAAADTRYRRNRLLAAARALHRRSSPLRDRLFRRRRSPRRHSRREAAGARLHSVRLHRKRRCGYLCSSFGASEVGCRNRL